VRRARFFANPMSSNHQLSPPVSISVITATWNCAGTIESCLRSVSAQRWPHREHVVIDGGSKDETLALLERHRRQIGTLVSEPDRGIYDALNKGIARARGDVVGFLHADDIYAHDDVLDKIAQAFADPSICGVYGDLQYVRKEDTSQVVRHWASEPFESSFLKRGWMPPHPTLYVRREWYQRIGGFDLNYRIAADYFSVLQLFQQPNFKAIHIPEVLIKMRVGGVSNRSLKNMVRKSREDYDALRRSGFTPSSAVMALAMKNLSKLSQFANS
jgi:glycosyltransferase involved in cell wall biosynthesis